MAFLHRPFVTDFVGLLLVLNKLRDGYSSSKGYITLSLRRLFLLVLLSLPSFIGLQGDRSVAIDTLRVMGALDVEMIAGAGEHQEEGHGVTRCLNCND
jgi:hypothetical protein